MHEQAWSIEAQGRVLKISRSTEHQGTPPPPPQRGEVTRFSRKSRKRLIDLFNRLDFTRRRVAFLTLTLHHHHTFNEAADMLRRFLERLRRKHPTAAAVWKRELQKRGVIHYHLVTFGMPYYPQDALQRVWTECTGEDLSIIDIRRVGAHSQLMQYVSKYVAKVQDTDGVPSLENQPYLHAGENQSTGRWWGVHNRAEIPFAELREGNLWSLETIKYLRWAMSCLSRGYANGNQCGATFYTDDAYRMIETALHLQLHMSDRPLLEQRKWEYLKHGAYTVQALSEIRQARMTVGESVQSLTEALILVRYRKPTAPPHEVIAAAGRLYTACNPYSINGILGRR